MFERILYAAESGDGRPRSLDYVVDLATRDGAEVYVLRVGELNEEQLALANKVEPDPESVKEEAAVDARVEGRLTSSDAAEVLRNAGVFAQTITRAGRIGDEVLRAADEIGADLIIIGSAPRSALTALLTGNVTDEIVRRSHQPVLVVPQLPAKQEEEGA